MGDVCRDPYLQSSRHPGWPKIWLCRCVWHPQHCHPFGTLRKQREIFSILCVKPSFWYAVIIDEVDYSPWLKSLLAQFSSCQPRFCTNHVIRIWCYSVSNVNILEIQAKYKQEEWKCSFQPWVMASLGFHLYLDFLCSPTATILLWTWCSRSSHMMVLKSEPLITRVHVFIIHPFQLNGHVIWHTSLPYWRLDPGYGYYLELLVHIFPCMGSCECSVYQWTTDATTSLAFYVN